MKMTTGAKERQKKVASPLHYSLSSDSVLVTAGSVRRFPGSPAPPGWHIYMCSRKKVCCVSQHSLKRMDQIPGDCPSMTVSSSPCVTAKLSKIDSMRVTWGPYIPELDPCSQPSTVQLNWHSVELAGQPLAPCSFHRWEKYHTEHMWQAGKKLETLWSCHIIPQGLSIEGCTDLCVIAKGTLNTVRFQDETLRAIVRN